MYKRSLTKTEQLVGDGITSNFDLDKAGRKLFGDKFAGAFSSDMIPTLTSQKPYAILNVDNSSMPGSHWIAIRYLGPATANNKTKIEYFDSFNRAPLRLMPSLKGYRIVKDPTDEPGEKQAIEQQNCGARSLAKLLQWSKE